MGKGMPQKNRNHKFARAALCATFGIVLVIAGSTAVFAGDDDDDDLPDTKFLKGMLRGLGLRNGAGEGPKTRGAPAVGGPPKPRSAGPRYRRLAGGDQSGLASRSG